MVVMALYCVESSEDEHRTAIDIRDRERKVVIYKCDLIAGIRRGMQDISVNVEAGATRFDAISIHEKMYLRIGTGRWGKDVLRNTLSASFAPRVSLAVLVSRDSLDKGTFIRSNQMHPTVVQMDWGVEMPFGAPSSRPLINARAESITSKPFFRDPMVRGRRCAVLTQGFYEWQKSPSGKRPYFIYMPDDEEDSKTGTNIEHNCKLMPLAGLYFPKRNASSPFGYVIVTVDASPGVDSIHDRMPAILDSDEAVLNWIDCRNYNSVEVLLQAAKYLHPYRSLRYHAVSTRVNHSEYDNPENIQPLDESKLAGESGKKQTPLKSFFSPKKEETN